MNTKEAIDNVKDTYDCHSNDRACSKEDRERIEKEKNNIIELLQRGKKDKKELKKVWQMWGELKKKYGGKMIDIDEEENTFSLLFDAIEQIEQKYFPKPEKK